MGKGGGREERMVGGKEKGGGKIMCFYIGAHKLHLACWPVFVNTVSLGHSCAHLFTYNFLLQMWK